MKRYTFAASVALLSAAFMVGCQDQGSGPIGPDGLGPQFHHRPGHDKGGGKDGGDDKTALVAFDAPLLSTAQTVGVVSNKNSIYLEAPHDCGKFGCFDNALNLSTLTGDCTTDPANMETAFPKVFARLIDHLDDLVQNRTLFSKIDLKSVRDRQGDPLASPKASKVHNISQTWTDDVNGRDYTTDLGTHGLRPDELVTVTETFANVFEFSEGSWRSWERDTPLPGSPHGAFLVCKNIGTVTMTVTEQ